MAGKVIDVVFSTLVQGVYIVTTRLGDKVNGMTAAWVSQVSFNPVLLMVSIAPMRYSHDLIKESRVFALNLLTSEQVDLGKRFGYKSGRKVDKFAGLEYTTAATGAPILPQAYAYYDLKLVDTFPAGDHTLFVGEAVDAKILQPDAQPLIFHKSDFF
ncbi:MAG: flavin reductase [Deltaproteobacteria bacterium RBG_13_58_19]|nr:MAG: flavin reductase [Deltaproteobacteria bacterium RBG_13_58_19]